MNKKSIVLVNPNSSGGQTEKNWDSIYSILKKYFGNDIETVSTKKSGDGTSLTREYLEKGYDNIIPIGGDGMLNEVANGFFKSNLDDNFKLNNTNDNKNLSSSIHLEAINSSAVLTVLPGGTRNILVKSLGLPSEFEECCRTVSSTDNSKKIDVIATVANVKNDAENGNYVYRIFLNAAEIGIGAEIINRSKMVRNKISSRILSTITGILTTLPTYQSNICEVMEFSTSPSDARINKMLTKMTMATISNGRFMGGGFNAATKAEMNDGLLDTIIVKHSSSFKMLNKLVDIKKGEESISNQDDIYYGQSQAVALLSKIEDNITVSVDGEPIGILPAFFRVFPLSIKIKS